MNFDTCAVPSVCNAVGLLILLKLCPVFTFFQQLMTKKIVSHVHMHLFSNVLHRRRRISPRRPMYLLIVRSHYCVMRFAYALHMRQQSFVPFPCLYIEFFELVIEVILNNFHKTLTGRNHSVPFRALSQRSFFQCLLPFPSAILCCISA